MKYYDFLQFFLHYSVSFSDDFKQLKYVGGIDISFSKYDITNACISLVVIDIDTLKTVLTHSEFVKMKVRYIPGYLAFRETPHINSVLKTIKRTSPSFYPDILLVDGNGRLHKKEFGLACHTGVLSNIPCIGVAKNFYFVDGCVKEQNHKDAMCSLTFPGESFNFTNLAGNRIGCAIKTTEDSGKPIYVSEGHRVCLETAKEVVLKCCRYRVPEPIRLADILSRKILRDSEEGKRQSFLG